MASSRRSVCVFALKWKTGVGGGKALFIVDVRVRGLNERE